MDDKTEILIQGLADKLGTTREHLWGVLLNQAPITGITDLCILICWWVAVITAFLYIKKKSTRPRYRLEGMYDECVGPAAWGEIDRSFAWAFWGVTLIITVLVTAVGLRKIVAALINPEYWVLTQILG